MGTRKADKYIQIRCDLSAGSEAALLRAEGEGPPLVDLHGLRAQAAAEAHGDAVEVRQESPEGRVELHEGRRVPCGEGEQRLRAILQLRTSSRQGRLAAWHPEGQSAAAHQGVHGI